MDDRQLLARYVADRSSADFAELVRRYAPLVYGSARRQVRDEHLADDITQAVFLLLWQKASQVKGPLAGWLVTATHLTARNAMKLSNRRQYHEKLAARNRPEHAEAETEVTWERYAPMVDAAMNRLTRAQRDCIAMRFLRGLSLAEIAVALGISQPAAQKRVNRSLSQLRQNMLGSTAVPSLAAFAHQLTASGVVNPPAHLLAQLGANSIGGAVVRTLATRTVRAMRWAKVKAFAVTISAVAVVGGGGGALISRAIHRNAPPLMAQTQPALQAATTMTNQPVVPPGVTPITLDIKDMDARDALREISRQASVQTALYPDSLWSGNNGQLSYRVSLHLDHAPFWSAMAALCGQTLSVPQVMYGSPLITICNAGGDQSNDQLGGRMFTSGPFTTVIESISHDRDISFGAGFTNRRDNLRMKIYIDPATHLLLYGAPWLETAVDDRGTSMIASDPSRNEALLTPFGSDWMLQHDLPLRFPTTSGKKLVVLKGAFQAVTEISSTTLTIDDLTHALNKPVKKAGRTITLLACQMENQRGSLTFTLARSGANHLPNQSVMEEAWHNISIFGADGKAMKVSFISSGFSDNGTLQCDISATSPIKLPLQLVWKIITESKSQTVPFEFHDVPLPAD